jgi:hypothetical protein
MEGLCDDCAIEYVGQNGLAGRQVSNDGRLRISFVNMQDVAHGYFLSAELSRVRIVSDLQRTARNVLSVTPEKLLDVVPIDGQAAIIAEVSADWLSSMQPSELDRHVYRLR